MGNPLPAEILSIYTESSGLQKLLTYFLDNLSTSINGINKKKNLFQIVMSFFVILILFLSPHTSPISEYRHYSFYVVIFSCQYDTNEMHLQFQSIGTFTIDFYFYMNIILPLIFSNWLLNIEECIKERKSWPPTAFLLLLLLIQWSLFHYEGFNVYSSISSWKLSFQTKRETIKFIFYIKQMKFLK